MDMRVWQIGTGDRGRSYAEWMLKNGLALLGSGGEGKYRQDCYTNHPMIRWFADSAQPGDIVLAKRGRHHVLAIGVLGKYDFAEDLDDVEGWDSSHYRRVRWIPDTAHLFREPVLGRRRFEGCKNATVLEWVRRHVRTADVAAPDHEKLRASELLGPPLDSTRLDPSLAGAIGRGKKWANLYWHGDFGARPTEAEMIAHCVVPLLEALGWRPEQVAIGWKYADLALFASSRRTSEQCLALIEVKRLGDGLDLARSQVNRYRDGLGHFVPVVVTDGVRYLLYPSREVDEVVRLYTPSPRESAHALFEALRAP